jgi:hypothetical protein
MRKAKKEGKAEEYKKLKKPCPQSSGSASWTFACPTLPWAVVRVGGVLLNVSNASLTQP